MRKKTKSKINKKAITNMKMKTIEKHMTKAVLHHNKGAEHHKMAADKHAKGLHKGAATHHKKSAMHHEKAAVHQAKAHEHAKMMKHEKVEKKLIGKLAKMHKKY